MGKKHRARINQPKKITIFPKRRSSLNTKHTIKNILAANVRMGLGTICNKKAHS